MQIEKQMIDIVNRNRERRIIMDRIDRDLDCERMADRLNMIAARRRKRDKQSRIDRLDNRGRKIAAQKAAYREANREKINTYMRKYMREYNRKKKEAASRSSSPESSKGKITTAIIANG